MTSPIGERLRRREDPVMIQGQARYADDIRLPGMLYAAFVRSPHAHARITSLDLAKARRMPGVVAAFGARDLPALARPMVGAMDRPDIAARTESPLSTNGVRYDGAPVALVVADDPYRAADAAAAVSVTYEPLPPMLDPAQAQQDGAPLVHDSDRVGQRVRPCRGWRRRGGTCHRRLTLERTEPGHDVRAGLRGAPGRPRRTGNRDVGRHRRHGRGDGHVRQPHGRDGRERRCFGRTLNSLPIRFEQLSNVKR